MQAHAAAHEHAFDVRRFAQAFQVFRGCAEPHRAFDAGAFVSAAVEEHEFAGGRQVLDVALEVPLAALPVVRFFERHDAHAARIGVLGEALDGPALAGGIAALEQDDMRWPVSFTSSAPEQFDLELLLLRRVVAAALAGAIGLIGRERCAGAVLVATEPPPSQGGLGGQPGLRTRLHDGCGIGEGSGDAVSTAEGTGSTAGGGVGPVAVIAKHARGTQRQDVQRKCSCDADASRS